MYHKASTTRRGSTSFKFYGLIFMFKYLGLTYTFFLKFTMY